MTDTVHEAASACSIFELRQYTLRPGTRDVLIELFDREFVETQEACGMRIIGQFRDLDAPDRFVWIRAFADMTVRAAALTAFYGGPVWAAHRDAARETMVDTDDALLLRPISGRDGRLMEGISRPQVGTREVASSLVTTTICSRDIPIDEDFAGFFESEVKPLLIETGAEPIACYETEHAENTYPSLPVRLGENVFIWLSRFATRNAYEVHLARLSRSSRWTGSVLPDLRARLNKDPQTLRLTPTSRSAFR